MTTKGSNRIAIGATNMAILRGELDVSAWDDEELQRGQRKNKHGKWSGRKPRIVPKEVHDELVRRTFSAANTEILSNLGKAVSTMATLLDDPDSSVRYNASKFIIERVMGKTPERIDLSVAVKAKWETAIEGAVVSLADLPAIEAWGEEDDDGEGRFRD